VKGQKILAGDSIREGKRGRSWKYFISGQVGKQARAGQRKCRGSNQKIGQRRLEE
jgi:hypothetical protein